MTAKTLFILQVNSRTWQRDPLVSNTLFSVFILWIWLRPLQITHWPFNDPTFFIGIKIWPLCCYHPHKPHNFVIAFIIKMLKSFQNSISSKAKLNWREPPASAPLRRSLHSITFKLTSRAHRCVGYRFFISSCGPTGSFSTAQPEMIGYEEEIRFRWGSNSKLTIFTPQPHPAAAPLWSREELYCRALLSSWCW